VSTKSSCPLTIIITTYNRPQLLPRAVRSALSQTVEDIEVLVVDDGSTKPVDLPTHPKLTVLRLPVNRGLAAARNAGAAGARGRWITHLDDDDELLPCFAEVSIDALLRTREPRPVAVISGLEEVNQHGDVIETHFPPTLSRGSFFGFADIEPRLSFFSKQTLVVERELLRQVGGFDESLAALPYTELFLRLNQVCTILGLPVVTYRQLVHAGARLSRDRSRRRSDYDRLVTRHRNLLDAHPKLFAAVALRQARALYAFGDVRGALVGLAQAVRCEPRHALRRITPLVLRAALGRR